MSVAINPVHNTLVGRTGAASVVPPAEVWDVDFAPKSRTGGAGVRAISGSHRMDARSSAKGSLDGFSNVNAFETRHETRDTLLLGVCMTAALLIGSAFGGVFSAQTEDPSSMSSGQDAHSAVAATAR